MTFINNKCPRLPLAVFSRSFQCSVNTRTAAGSQEGSGLYCDSEMYRGWGCYMQTKHSERFLICALLIQMLVYTAMWTHMR